ncbi:hypothetical protein PO909_028120, partial [Leuciscus waleckii]
GDSVTLNPGLTEIGLRENHILWESEKETLAFTDGRFRDRLKLDNQTGSLTITNITTEQAGIYKLHITRAESFLPKKFNVSVYDSVHCCGPTEAVIRLVLSALVGVATVIVLVYEIRSRRAEQDQAHIHTSGSIEI